MQRTVKQTFDTPRNVPASFATPQRVPARSKGVRVLVCGDMPGKRGGAVPAPVWVRFWSKVDRSGDHWLWTGAVNDSGYGVIYDGKRLVYAHRLSWLLHGFEIPTDFDLDHLCVTRLCVRPDHLEPTTHGDNVRRAWARRKAA